VGGLVIFGGIELKSGAPAPMFSNLVGERLFPNGRVIELIGNPMPGGGFVMSFTDITAYREAEQGLKGANESLEQRVQERTQELSQLNQELSEAKSNAEAANQS
ncbi:PAS-domain containing protein, partial [Salmonella sp. SAL4457]|uniref:PAS-domain containing protein n=1 Tax=Salmonella sp. SAL4457 TaxID=3159912 RepID=UPI00397AB559